MNDEQQQETAQPAGVAVESLIMPSVLRFCRYAFVMAAAMDVITLVSSDFATAGVRATYVVMILCYLGFVGAFKVNMDRLLTDAHFSVIFTRMAWGVVATGLMVRMGIALFTAGDLATMGDAVLSVFVGLIVLYLLAFILLDKRHAIVSSVLIMAVSVVMVVARVAIERGPVLLADVQPYGRAYGVHAIIIGYLYVLARTKEMLSESHTAASALTVTAGTDELTGLANRRQLSTTLEREIAQSRRQLVPLAVVLVDLDHFKSVNDTHGHAAGDEVLQVTASVLADATRDSDLVGRWGGEEFLVVLPAADVDVAARVAERCRTSLRDHAFPAVGRVTASFGVALLEPDDDAEAVVARADEALYRAKDLGRDRVELATPSSDPTLLPFHAQPTTTDA